ncbi:HNH endonuclease [Streptomyces microflavus]|uniref:HNH endonuclease n=1 Tax=Streptomyces microflavus TaxID=1919 RepID=UPI00380DB7E3
MGKRNGKQRYRADCKPCNRAACSDWRTANSEARITYGRAYDRKRSAIPERQEAVRATSARRRARKRNATVEPFTAAEFAAHWDNIGAYGCVVCDAPYEHADHIMPLALGGEHSVWNLLPMCSTHNTSKGAKNPYRWITEIAPKSRIGRNLLAAMGDA